MDPTSKEHWTMKLKIRVTEYNCQVENRRLMIITSTSVLFAFYQSSSRFKISRLSKI
jgi:hypothetical protein